jgi:hypothetical protein
MRGEKMSIKSEEQIAEENMVNVEAAKKRQAISKANEEFHRMHEQRKQEQLAIEKMKAASEKASREALEKQTFGWESEKQKAIRYRLMQIGDSINNINGSSSYVEDKEERLFTLKTDYDELLKEYVSTPVEIGNETFKQILVFETEAGNKQLISKDGGKTYRLFEDCGGGLKTMSTKRVLSKDGVPIQIIGSFSTNYTRCFLKSYAIPTSVNIRVTY